MSLQITQIPILSGLEMKMRQEKTGDKVILDTEAAIKETKGSSRAGPLQGTEDPKIWPTEAELGK
jgi:hypothetical protein